MYLKRALALRERNRLLKAVARGDAYSAADLQIGQEGVLLPVIGAENLRQRLASMGVMAGVVITAPMTSLFENPRTYTVRGFQLAMRTEEAAMILLQTEAESARKLMDQGGNM